MFTGLTETFHIRELYRDHLFNMPGLDRGVADPSQYAGKKKPVPKVGKGSGILDENGVS